GQRRESTATIGGAELSPSSGFDGFNFNELIRVVTEDGDFPSILGASFFSKTAASASTRSLGMEDAA
ncbi:hypothetical protein, partial [Cryobacterium sp. Y11]|uniref:hypothetical protein n=1 Tax=Cryobacterium sp. Y11 TaxID=2045016 RepID=UPI001E3C27A3